MYWGGVAKYFDVILLFLGIVRRGTSDGVSRPPMLRAYSCSLYDRTDDAHHSADATRMSSGLCQETQS